MLSWVSSTSAISTTSMSFLKDPKSSIFGAKEVRASKCATALICYQGNQVTGEFDLKTSLDGEIKVCGLGNSETKRMNKKSIGQTSCNQKEIKPMGETSGLSAEKPVIGFSKDTQTSQKNLSPNIPLLHSDNLDAGLTFSEKATTFVLLDDSLRSYLGLTNHSLRLNTDTLGESRSRIHSHDHHTKGAEVGGTCVASGWGLKKRRPREEALPRRRRRQRRGKIGEGAELHAGNGAGPIAVTDMKRETDVGVSIGDSFPLSAAPSRYKRSVSTKSFPYPTRSPDPISTSDGILERSTSASLQSHPSFSQTSTLSASGFNP